MVAIYRHGALIQSAPGPKEVQRKTDLSQGYVWGSNTPVEVHKRDCETLKVLWFQPKVTLKEIRKQTHWRSASQISKVARITLGLPCRYVVRKGYSG